jgi:serine/threonine protein kinase
MEPASTDLESYRADELHVETQYNMIQQLLLAVYAIKSVYGIYHRDIKLANVLIKRIQPGGYFAYVINSKPYYIKNSGIFLCLADFGVATSFMPIRETTKLTNNRYGSRNAEIMTDKTTGELYYKPITCNYNAYRDKKGKGIRSKATPRIWFDERTNSRIVGTTNQFVKGVDIKPNTPVVLTDTVRFPPFEFFNDIQDVLRMFASGKRMLQPGNHPGFVHLDDQLRAKINSCVKNVFPYEIYGAVKYVRADAMLDEFYTPIPKPTDVVDTYIM